MKKGHYAKKTVAKILGMTLQRLEEVIKQGIIPWPCVFDHKGNKVRRGH